MEVAALKSQSKAPKYKVGDKLDSYNQAIGVAIPVTIVGVRTVYDCHTEGSEYPVGHSEDELKERYEQTPKQHPVKVGEWVRRTSEPYGGVSIGTIGKVLGFAAEHYSIAVEQCWYFKYCEPCDPPGSTHAEPDLTQLHAKGKEAWSDVPNATQWVEDMRGNTESSHDTPAGKEAAESVIRDFRSGDSEVSITGLFDDTKITVRREPDQDHGARIVISDANDMGEANIYLTESGARQMATALIGLCDVRKVPQ